jgi:protein SCO1/2
MGRSSSHGFAVATSLALVALAAMLARPVWAAGSGGHWGADYFPNLTLTTQDGKTVRFYDDLLKDKVVAVDLIYTHCKFSCPLETARLVQVQRMLGDRVGKDIYFYSITLDPKRDTPEVLKAYAEKFHAGSGWLFLTGKEQDIKTIARKLGLYFDAPDANRDGHTPQLVLGNTTTGQWVNQSALDNPRFLAIAMTRFLDGYGHNPAAKSYAEARQLSFTKGQYLFSTRCAACHTIGQGTRIGPDLAGVTHARERRWLERFIAAPDRMLAEGDPTAKALYERYERVNMPSLGLGPADVEALVDYLEAETAALHAGTSARASAGAP